MSATENSKGFVMRVPKSILEANGFHPGQDRRREIVKFVVEWKSVGTSRAESVFANYYPTDRRAEVYLGRLDHGSSERFSVRKAQGFSLANFVKDFNDSRPLNLQNLSLGASAGAAWMEIDGRKIPFSDYKMTTFGSMVNLLAEIEGGPSVKFEYDGRSAVARFKGHPAIEFLQVSGDELEIRYAQSKDEKHVYRVNRKNGKPCTGVTALPLGDVGLAHLGL